MHSRAEKLFWTLWIGLFLSGCTSVPLRAKQPPNPDRASLQASTALPRTSEGSLWSGRNYASVYADVKAREVGDIVTISIVESASASKNATTSTGRESGAEASWSGIFDAALSGVKINGKEIGNTHKIDFANTFDGKGQTTRTSYMTAQISARVINVLENGNMVVRGTREVRVNNENQYITIAGIIRPEDISSNNVILSSYVSDAVIELSGHGVISDKQRVGWLSRVLDWVWPF